MCGTVSQIAYLAIIFLFISQSLYCSVSGIVDTVAKTKQWPDNTLAAEIRHEISKGQSPKDEAALKLLLLVHLVNLDNAEAFQEALEIVSSISDSDAEPWQVSYGEYQAIVVYGLTANYEKQSTAARNYLNENKHMYLDQGDSHWDKIRNTFQINSVNSKEAVLFLAANAYLQTGEYDKAENMMEAITNPEFEKILSKALALEKKMDAMPTIEEVTASDGSEDEAEQQGKSNSQGVVLGDSTQEANKEKNISWWPWALGGGVILLIVLFVASRSRSKA